MKATIQTQGSQFTVQQGDKLFVNRYPDKNEGDLVTIDQVLMLVEDGKATFGAPTVEGATVKAKILENKKDKKDYHFSKRNEVKDTREEKGIANTSQSLKLNLLK